MTETSAIDSHRPRALLDAAAGAPAAPGGTATLSDTVYADLREALLTGVWQPGQRITARAVARHYAVSLSPARDAMTRLANEGGLHLSETRMYSVPLLSAADYLETTSIRLALEPMAAELAAGRLTAAERAGLARTNAAMRACVEAERFQEGLILDSRFHLGIYRACGSALLQQMIGTLWLRIGPTRNRLSHTYRRGLSGYKLHLKILDALEARDGAAAARLIRRDLRGGAEQIALALAEAAAA